MQPGMQKIADQAGPSPPSGKDTTTFHCPLCQRIFNKQSTFKRHGYYCRSRPVHQRKSRKRACSTCVQAKVRCDSQIPSCSRCLLRKSSCVYNGLLGSENVLGGATISPPSKKVEATVAEDSNIRMGSGPTTNNTLSPIGFPIENAENDLDYSTLNEGVFVSSRPQHSSLANADWNTSMMGTSLQTFISQSFNNSNGSLGLQTATSPHSKFWPPMDRNSFPCPDTSLIGSIPPTLSATHLIRSFAPRKFSKPGPRACEMLLLQILKGYPKMMTRKETLPPFIHPSCIPNSGSAKSSKQDTLTNCVILSMLFCADTGGRKLLWNMIRMEQERISQNYHSFGRWELLAAVQAVLIYVLMRLIEGPTENTNFDASLLSLFPTLGRELVLTHDGCKRDDINPELPQSYLWRDWVFHESRRRTFTVFHLLDLLFDLEPASVCPPAWGFLIMPLPASKALWEAKTGEAWHVEVEAGMKSNGVFGLLPNGQLAKLVRFNGWEMEKEIPTAMHREKYADEIWKSGENWTDWSAGMDIFGHLIMIAALLVSDEEH